MARPEGEVQVSKAFETKYEPFHETTKQKIVRILGLSTIKEYLREIWRFGTGKIGLILFAVLLFTSIVAAVTMPPNFTDEWNNPKHWETNPQTVPPEWIKYLGIPVAEHKLDEIPGSKYEITYIVETVQYGNIQREIKTPVLHYVSEYRLDVDAFPSNLMFRIYRIKALDRYKIYGEQAGQRYAMPKIKIVLYRPDGINITLVEDLPQLTANETINGEIFAYVTQPYSKIPDVSKIATNETLNQFARLYGVNLTAADIPAEKITHFLFGIPEVVQGENRTAIGYTPLKGTYKIDVQIITLPDTPISYLDNEVGKVEVVYKGSAYGIMGTDHLGRDLAIGLFYGFPIAMAIGVVVAFVNTVIGLILGVISGYYGGWVDEFIQRTVDVIGNIPLLPILILIASIAIMIFHEPVYRLWLIMLVLIVFGWGGLTIVIRSMALSIKSEPYIEAAKCLGASNKRIIFLHITPQVIPYAVASMVFSVPGAILAEAGLAVIGIYHGYPTWGLILSAARSYGRVDLWWWIIPPGLLIAITSLTFVLLGMALERIVEPRLRTR